MGPPAVTGEAEAIRLLAAGAWGRVRRAFLGIFSIRGRLHTGFWAKGRRNGPHPVEKRAALEALGFRIRTLSAVLCARSRTRGLRDAENSGIYTPPPGVPVGKKQPTRRNMQSAGQFMQKGGCGCACRSAFLPADAAPRVALNIFGKTLKVIERNHVIGKQVGYLITHSAAANIVYQHS